MCHLCKSPHVPDMCLRSNVPRLPHSRDARRGGSRVPPPHPRPRGSPLSQGPLRPRLRDAPESQASPRSPATGLAVLPRPVWVSPLLASPCPFAPKFPFRLLPRSPFTSHARSTCSLSRSHPACRARSLHYYPALLFGCPVLPFVAPLFPISTSLPRRAALLQANLICLPS